jgi:hypothetical protein
MGDNLPPPGGTYAAVASVHRFGPVGEIQLRGSSHSGFSNSAPPPPAVPGAFTLHDFDSTIEGDLFIQNVFTTHVVAGGRTSVRVDFFGVIGSERSFDTEVLRLDISGGNLPPGLLIRESPTLASLGRTTVRGLAGGQFEVNSFFDIFTELSLDGGVNWIPSNGATRMTLVPEPTPMLLLIGGIAGMALFTRRRRRDRDQSA